MDQVKTNSWRDRIVDKEKAKRVIERVNQQTGFVPDPTATPRKAQELMREFGVRAEDNLFSCGIISARDEE